MKFWKCIEVDDGICQSQTEEGLPFWEMEIQGWNEDTTFTVLTDLVTIRAVLPNSHSEVEIIVKYAHPELQQDLIIDKLVNQAKSDLQAAVYDFIQTD